MEVCVGYSQRFLRGAEQGRSGWSHLQYMSLLGPFPDLPPGLSPADPDIYVLRDSMTLISMSCAILTSQRCLPGHSKAKGRPSSAIVKPQTLTLFGGETRCLPFFCVRCVVLRGRVWGGSGGA